MAKRPERKKTDKSGLPTPEQVEQAAQEISGQQKNTDSKKSRPGRPETEHKLERFSTFMSGEHKAKLKIIATLENRNIYELLADAVEVVIDDYRDKYPDVLK